MSINKNYRYQVFEKASLARNFEEEVITNVKNKRIKIPVYVSAGQEFIASSIAAICNKKKLNHYYLVNTDVIQLIYLLGEIKLN